MQNDNEWIAKVLIDDDQEAFAMILKKYQSPIRSFFRKVTSGHLEVADDLSQETFILVYKNLGQFKGQSKFLTWIYSIARNVYLSYLRKTKNEVKHLEASSSIYDMRSDSQLDLIQIFKYLNPEERLILCLSYAEGLTHQEVAEMINKPVGTVKTIILRAKEKIQSQFSAPQEKSV